MEGLVFGVSAVVFTVGSGIASTITTPGAMLDALLAPFSNERWLRHVKYKVDKYYEHLTRDSLQTRFRYDLSLEHREGHGSELRRALKRQNPLRRLFEKFAVDEGGRKVWTERQFRAFLADRIGDEKATSLLWRCFCYNAAYPFTDPSFRAYSVDIDGWTQAIVLLSKDGSHELGRNWASSICLYGRGKRSIWRRFASFSNNIPGTGDERPPLDMLHDVSEVVATQLPIVLPLRGPSLEEIRLRVEWLVEGSIAIPTGSMIPYHDMLALVQLILQITERNERASFPGDGDASLATAIAKAILETAGIRPDVPIPLAKYLAFSERFQSPDTQRLAWSFDSQITRLWYGLFSQEDVTTTKDCAQKNPPPVILQALDFIYPLEQDAYDWQGRQRSELEYSIDSHSGLSREKVLDALTWPYGPKLAVIYGTVTTYGTTQSTVSTPRTIEPVVFIIMTSSPLWCTYKNGKTDDFRIGGSHVLLQLAPEVHALHYSNTSTTYTDMVDITNEDEIAFGRNTVGDESILSAGLILNFRNNTAILQHSPARRKRKEQLGYVEIPTGPQGSQIKNPHSASAWETNMQVQKMEIYKMRDGVMTGLSVRRE